MSCSFLLASATLYERRPSERKRVTPRGVPVNRYDIGVSAAGTAEPLFLQFSAELRGVHIRATEQHADLLIRARHISSADQRGERRSAARFGRDAQPVP